MVGTQSKMDINRATWNRYMVFVYRNGPVFTFHKSDPDRRYVTYCPEINREIQKVGV